VPGDTAQIMRDSLFQRRGTTQGWERGHGVKTKGKSITLRRRRNRAMSPEFRREKKKDQR